MREEQAPALPDGVPPPELIGRLASEAYRAAPAGEPGDSLKVAFDGLADRCPGPSLLRDLMRASASSNGASASDTAPASNPAAPAPVLGSALPPPPLPGGAISTLPASSRQ